MTSASGVVLRMNGGPDVHFEDVDEIGFSYTPWESEYDVQPTFSPIFTLRSVASMPGEPHRPRIARGPLEVGDQSQLIDLSQISEAVNKVVAGTPLPPDAPKRRVLVTIRSSAGWFRTQMPELWAAEFFSQIGQKIHHAMTHHGLTLHEGLIEDIATTRHHPLMSLVTGQDAK
ncbi:hypothetical protein [Pseudarthrobacter sp. BIM B-2242]|uniref:hypothetical protein n=1 Tax=Pseudarthrobacter sp. BIM B-2242 TaxID=2772401 RepID=UPI00168B211D|nr:hypothetical protein [Pseudarthrobacter sp. BIM B-2242]QOD06141.1 hypothetical protein IDT60_21520 [Pseudarthrobacter sp. BIM B-2242]